MNLTDAYRASTPRKKKFRVGRGESSGLGKTSGRGHKGQKARAGVSFRPYFEGGQMSLVRRLPKRGFNNAAFRTEYEIVHLGEIAARFAAGEVVDPASLRARSLVRRDAPIKLLADGDLDKKLTIRVHRASKSAADKVSKAGGTLELIVPESKPAADRPPVAPKGPKA